MKPCPFCKNSAIMFAVDVSQGMKYGACVCADCFARGPEVRTSCDTSENTEWHTLAEKEWDIRV